jgi:hypothetical protein
MCSYPAVLKGYSRNRLFLVAMLKATLRSSCTRGKGWGGYISQTSVTKQRLMLSDTEECLKQRIAPVARAVAPLANHVSAMFNEFACG